MPSEREMGGGRKTEVEKSKEYRKSQGRLKKKKKVEEAIGLLCDEAETSPHQHFSQALLCTTVRRVEWSKRKLAKKRERERERREIR